MRSIKYIVASLVSLAACKSDSALPPSPLETPGGEQRWEFATAAGLPLATLRDATGAPFLYVALKEGGLLVLRLNGSATPTEVARLSITAFGGQHVTALAQRGTQLLVGVGDFFSNQGAKAGLAVVNVQNPEQPRVLRSWISPTAMTGATALLVEGTRAFLAAKRQGVLVFDLSGSDTIRHIATILPDPHFPKPNPNETEHPNARGLAAVGNMLYVANDAGGLRIIDITDLARPVEVGRYVNAQVTGKSQAYNSVAISGQRAFLAVDYCGVEVVDVSTPSAVRQVGWWNPWTCQSPSNIWFNSPGHTNQLVLDAARSRVHVSAGASELVTLDVTDPTHPTLRGSFKAAGSKQGAWGVSLGSGETYLSYITAVIPFVGTWSGIRALTTIH